MRAMQLRFFEKGPICASPWYRHQYWLATEKGHPHLKDTPPHEGEYRAGWTIRT